MHFQHHYLSHKAVIFKITQTLFIKYPMCITAMMAKVCWRLELYTIFSTYKLQAITIRSVHVGGPDYREGPLVREIANLSSIIIRLKINHLAYEAEILL
jgi:hypothetical protein